MSAILNLFKDYELNNKLIFKVTDMVGNLVNAYKESKLYRFNCLAHLIHLLISVDLNKVYKEFDRIVRKCRKIYDKLEYMKHILEQYKLNEINYLDNYEQNEIPDQRCITIIMIIIIQYYI